jgi:serine/threonine protein phosphatase PrpC
MPNPLDMETAEYNLVISPSAADAETPRPFSTSVRAEFGAVSHPGMVRSRNEDHFFVAQAVREQRVLLSNLPEDHIPVPMGDEGYVVIVADGMGGMAAGEVASRQAIATGLKLIQNSPKWGFKINKKEARELFERVNRHLQEIDRTLTEQSYSDRRLYGMGTTLTAAYSVGVDLFVIHVGDSRAYLYRNGDLRQLTRDHTVAQALADAGMIAPAEVRHHKRRNVLTNFLGGHQGRVKGDVRWLRLTDGDRVLVCTDGLTEMVDDRTIAEIIRRHHEPPAAAQALVDEALRRGGHDNVTVVLGRYHIPGLPQSNRIAGHAEVPESIPTASSPDRPQSLEIPAPA